MGGRAPGRVNRASPLFNRELLLGTVEDPLVHPMMAWSSVTPKSQAELGRGRIFQRADASMATTMLRGGMKFMGSFCGTVLASLEPQLEAHYASWCWDSFVFFCLFAVWRQVLVRKPRLAVNSQGSSFPSLQRAGMAGVCHGTLRGVVLLYWSITSRSCFVSRKYRVSSFTPQGPGGSGGAAKVTLGQPRVESWLPAGSDGQW